MSTVAYADFGPLIATVDVDRAVLDTLKLWLPPYLGHLEESRGLGYELKRPPGRSYVNAVTAEQEWPDHELPAILVVTARTDSEPEILSEGMYTVPWLVAVSAVVRGQDGPNARELASLYDMAVRAIMVQHPTLGGVCGGVRWIGGGEARPLADPTKAGRYLGEGASQFRVFTDGTVQAGVGPTEVADSYEPFPDVAAVNVDVEVPLS